MLCTVDHSTAVSDFYITAECEAYCCDKIELTRLYTLDYRTKSTMDRNAVFISAIRPFAFLAYQASRAFQGLPGPSLPPSYSLRHYFQHLSRGRRRAISRGCRRVVFGACLVEVTGVPSDQSELALASLCHKGKCPVQEASSDSSGGLSRWFEVCFPNI
jgi:hypothetical protein